MKVCYSGTFNVLHKGHKHLIDKAFEFAGVDGTVYIGVTKGALLKKKKYVNTYENRVNAIRKYLMEKGLEKRCIIKKIFDQYGPAAVGDYDAMIVSPETENNAEDINKIRIRNGKKPLKIIKIPHIMADDNKPISSTRILNKEIDEEGRIIS
jgi:pantetheine-phosphate adenylyltransferase